MVEARPNTPGSGRDQISEKLKREGPSARLDLSLYSFYVDRCTKPGDCQPEITNYGSTIDLEWVAADQVR